MTFMLTKSSARFGIPCHGLTSILGLCVGVFFATFLAAQTVLAQSPPSSANTPNQTGQSTASSGRTESASTSSTTEVTDRLIVEGDELPSAYGAPGAFFRRRFALRPFFRRHHCLCPPSLGSVRRPDLSRGRVS